MTRVPVPERVVERDDPATGHRGFGVGGSRPLADRRRAGGCRFRRYPSPDDARDDALRLARGMTFKHARTELPFGGGKAVIAESGGSHDRPALSGGFGRAVGYSAAPMSRRRKLVPACPIWSPFAPGRRTSRAAPRGGRRTPRAIRRCGRRRACSMRSGCGHAPASRERSRRASLRRSGRGPCRRGALTPPSLEGRETDRRGGEPGPPGHDRPRPRRMYRRVPPTSSWPARSAMRSRGP